VWEKERETAFQTLKQKLPSQPILQYPDSSKEFILTTDASNDGAGTVLSQGDVGKDLPIPYVSRSFNKAEKNYSRVEKELAVPAIPVWYKFQSSKRPQTLDLDYECQRPSFEVAKMAYSVRRIRL
jgi:hypothetical protein